MDNEKLALNPIEAPKMTLEGELFTAPNPKIVLWRKVMSFQERKRTLPLDEASKGMIELIAEAFRDPKVTPERIETELEIEELIPLYNNITLWVSDKLISKMSQVPNAESPIS